MNGWRTYSPALMVIAVILVMVSSSLANVAGKISGVVRNKETEAPLVGVTVKVEGTRFITQTDQDGEYFIISVPVGKYNVTVSSVGFETVTHESVRVLVDLTTPVDFVIEPTTVKLQEEVVVTAKQAIIQKDLTASRVIFTADRLRQLPNIITVQSVLLNYPGVILDRDDNDDLHVRGGRAGQVSYYYDGFSVQDPFVARSGIKIMPSALEELSLTSGGYTAEYGEALSGVVGAVTREGDAEYKGNIKIFEGVTHPYNVTEADWGGLKRVGNRSMSFNVSGPIPALNPQKYTFFMAGEYLHDPTYLPHNGSVSYTGTGKLSVHPSQKLKLNGNFTYYRASGEEYEHRDQNGISYDLNLDGLLSFEKKSYLAGVSGQYSASERLILSMSVNRFLTSSKIAPDDLFDLYWNQWPGYSEDSAGNYNGTIHENNYANEIDYSDAAQLIGFRFGDNFKPSFEWREAAYNSVKFSVVSQINNSNQIKAGTEIRNYALDWDSKKFYNLNPYGEKYSNNPSYLSAYVQDKMEFDEFIINSGMRLDYRNSDVAYNINPNGQAPVYKEANSKLRLSPRLGIAFPISVKSKMHFNYGVYYQEPKFTHLYTNLQGDVSTGYPILGNPDLNPEQTTSYELGFDHLITDDLLFNVTAYAKDIDELVTARSYFQAGGYPVTQLTNDDYGSVKGFDITIEKLPLSGYVSGSISYGYMIATGIGSTSLEPYYTYITSTTDTLAPVTEYPLDFDQRHTVTAIVSVNAPSHWDVKFLGQKVPGAWDLNVVGHLGSGLPYTATDSKGSRLGERNSSRVSPNYTVDMRFNKDIGIGKSSSYMMGFFLEVDNLFNKRNILNVYTNTGRPDNDGEILGTSVAVNNPQQISFYNRLYDHDPQNFTPPRTIRMGIELSF